MWLHVLSEFDYNSMSIIFQYVGVGWVESVGVSVM